MDPASALNDCETAVKDAERSAAKGAPISEAYDALIAYYHWRVAGGFAPVGGDARAALLAGRLRAQLDLVG